jgi:hypothetical protein
VFGAYFVEKTEIHVLYPKIGSLQVVPPLFKKVGGRGRAME